MGLALARNAHSGIRRGTSTNCGRTSTTVSVLSQNRPLGLAEMRRPPATNSFSMSKPLALDRRRPLALARKRPLELNRRSPLALKRRRPLALARRRQLALAFSLARRRSSTTRPH